MNLHAAILCFLIQNLSFARLPEWSWMEEVSAARPFDPALSEWKGRPSLYVYFSPECGHCIDSWPGVLALARRARASGLRVGGIAVGGVQREDLLRFLEAYDDSMPVWFDSARTVAATYGIRSVPKVLFVEANGRVELFGDLTPRRWAQVEVIAKRIARAHP
ncbi:MAG: TlpA family protein disulfide reductase [Fibrobacterota bacterium]|nr:TlpA family protein disulfide reductase [Fibrobacterota bacterium]QQS03642.1 MAG: TlpA family protein disulfide reductase [Fibrobacterota bacterium]